MEKIVGLKELRQNVERYAKEVEKGKSFIIIRRTKPLFKITPLEDEGWEEVIDFSKIKRGGVAVEELLARI